MKTIDIFYKTYINDFNLLQYSLRSLQKNVSGYNKIIILVPNNQSDLFNKIQLPGGAEVFYINEHGNGYLFQQWCKMSAHKYSKADFILFADSDCIFDHDINIQDYVKDDRPEILYTPYDQVGDAICWKKPTEEFMDEPVDFEFMRRNCLIYHRSTLQAIDHYFPTLESIMMKSERFSEFNAMGAFAFKNEKEKYNFINTNNWQYTRPKAEQRWCYGKNDGTDEEQREYKRTLEVLNQVFNLQLKEI